MNELSYVEKLSLPHSVLLDPETQRAAAYTGNHRLITETATPALVQYAQNPEWKVQKFDARQHAQGLPEWRPLPAWATPDVQARLLLVHLRPHGVQSDAEWQTIPKK
ncbi:hypothetical protein [Polaromonas sp.]|uniref:hypothetical protein n=1 Tax=Polaromonas sp. TaxID=1869339 RepID=UPI003BB60F19